jgi:hypothetical protein
VTIPSRNKINYLKCSQKNIVEIAGEEECKLHLVQIK